MDILYVEEIMSKSHIKFNNKGEMYFNDDFYTSMWDLSTTQFTYYNYFFRLEEYTVSFNLKDIESKEFAWNQFGFLQNGQNNEDLIRTPYHKNKHFELNYILEGELKFKVENEEVFLKEGDFLLLNQNVYHAEYVKMENLKVVFIGANDIQRMRKALNQLKDDDLKFFLERSMNPSYTKAEYRVYRSNATKELMRKVIINLMDELKEKQIGYEAISYALLIRCLRLLEKEEYEELVQESKGYRHLIFEEIEGYILNNYQEVSIQKLVSVYGYSKDYFNRLIKEMTGLTYMQYLHRVRMNATIDLLVETDLKISEIAQRVGYQNQSHFYTLFQKETELSPKVYRERYRK